MKHRDVEEQYKKTVHKDTDALWQRIESSLPSTCEDAGNPFAEFEEPVQRRSRIKPFIQSGIAVAACALIAVIGYQVIMPVNDKSTACLEDAETANGAEILQEDAVNETAEDILQENEREDIDSAEKASSERQDAVGDKNVEYGAGEMLVTIDGKYYRVGQTMEMVKENERVLVTTILIQETEAATAVLPDNNADFAGAEIYQIEERMVMYYEGNYIELTAVEE